jgi:hypothetical protein
MKEYMSKMDSALLMISTILYLVRNEQTEFKDKHFEVPAVETLDNDLKDVIEAADEPIVTMVAEDEASVKKTVNDDAKEIAEATTEETAASVMEPINKDSEEYRQRIKNASNKFLAASGVLNKICPRGFHVGYAIAECKCAAKVVAEAKEIFEDPVEDAFDTPSEAAATAVTTEKTATPVEQFNVWCCGVAAIDCKCDAGFPSGKSNSDPYRNLTTASRSRGDDTK